MAGYCFCSWSLFNVFAAFHDLPEFMAGVLNNVPSVAGFFSFVVFIWMMLGSRRTVWVWVSAGSVVLDVLSRHRASFPRPDHK